MIRPSIHPATRLLFWMALLIAVQCLSGVALAAAFLALPCCGKPLLRRAARLVWRARWLLVSLLVIVSWGVAGDPLWPSDLAPTIEGCREALTHAGRLLLVLVGVAAFLEAMPVGDLLAATHVFLGPLRGFGIDADRAVVRLLLVLRYVEELPRPRDWRAVLDTPPVTRSERVEVSRSALCWTDYLLMLALLLATAFFCYR